MGCIPIENSSNASVSVTSAVSLSGISTSCTDIVWINWRTIYIAIAAVVKKNLQIYCASDILSGYRIIPAIRKHVIAENTLAGGDEGIGVEEATDLGIVISALEVIESQLLDSILAMTPFFRAGIVSCYSFNRYRRSSDSGLFMIHFCVYAFLRSDAV